MVRSEDQEPENQKQDSTYKPLALDMRSVILSPFYDHRGQRLGRRVEERSITSCDPQSLLPRDMVHKILVSPYALCLVTDFLPYCPTVLCVMIISQHLAMSPSIPDTARVQSANRMSAFSSMFHPHVYCVPLKDRICDKLNTTITSCGQCRRVPLPIGPPNQSSVRAVLLRHSIEWLP